MRMYQTRDTYAEFAEVIDGLTLYAALRSKKQRQIESLVKTQHVKIRKTCVESKRFNQINYIRQETLQVERLKLQTIVSKVVKVCK